MPSESDLPRISAQIEDLVQRIDFIADPAVRANMVTLVQSLMELHSQALGRVTELLSQEGESGRRVLHALAEDELAGGLLLLYGIHPEALETRVEKAVSKMQQHVRASGSTVELLGIEDGLVRVRLAVKGSSCGSTASGLEKTLEDLVYAAAPDVAGIQIEKEVAAPAGTSDLVQLQVNAPAARV